MLEGRIVFYCGYYRTESFQVISIVADSNWETDTEKFVLNAVTCSVSISAGVLILYIVSSALSASHLCHFYFCFLIWGRDG